jgi:hypothetical protein
MNAQEQIIANVAAQRAAGSTVILCLFTGAELPAACEPMARVPIPRTDIPLDAGFPQELARAVTQNPAVEDGAIMVGRETSDAPYRVVCWSFRLFPPPALARGPANRGSAFNSCLAMSNIAEVDCVYLVSERGVFAFRQGEVAETLLGTARMPSAARSS